MERKKIKKVRTGPMEKEKVQSRSLVSTELADEMRKLDTFDEASRRY